MRPSSPVHPEMVLGASIMHNKNKHVLELMCKGNPLFMYHLVVCIIEVAYN